MVENNGETLCNLNSRKPRDGLIWQKFRINTDSSAVQTQLCGWSLNPSLWSDFGSPILLFGWCDRVDRTTISWLIVGSYISWSSPWQAPRPTQCSDSICDCLEYNKINNYLQHFYSCSNVHWLCMLSEWSFGCECYLIHHWLPLLSDHAISMNPIYFLFCLMKYTNNQIVKQMFLLC